MVEGMVSFLILNLIFWGAVIWLAWNNILQPLLEKIFDLIDAKIDLLKAQRREVNKRDES